MPSGRPFHPARAHLARSAASKPTCRRRSPHLACPPCRAELSKLSEQHGADYVVTEADIKAATAAAMAAALGGGR